MNTFLDYVAHDVLKKYGTDLSRIAVVFPNKRASLFFNERLARIAERPIWSPSYITISELFRSHTTLQTGDQIKLICDLHKCFVQTTGINETLDHFYGWGQLLLADFDDIDKNMAEADKVFANLRDIHELDDISYLTDEQKAIIKQFFINFSEDHNSELKQRFLNLWSHFGDIYHNYNDRLQSQGLAYEGALYRSVATDENLTFEYDHYLFVGFNMVQKVEQQLFKRLQKEQKAHFYWDFDHYYLGDNEAGFYIKQYLAKFPNELDNKNEELYNNFTKDKQLTYISATTEHIQARYIAQWLKENGRIQAGKKTAIVLCDEAMLPMAIHALPDEVDKVNITTGYPLAQAPVSSLVMMLFSLQTAGYVVKSRKFRLSYINKVLRHPYISFLSDNCQELYNNLNDNHVYYATAEELGKDENLTLLFSLIDTQNSKAMCQYLIRIVSTIAKSSNLKSQTSNHKPQTSNLKPQTSNHKDPLFEETLFRTYTLLNRLYDLMEKGDLDIDLTTLHRLLSQLIQSTSVPFHGEPAVGLQMMGVLETRNLDFDHVLLLSCNEGNMPKGVSDTSFIPYSIRKAFDLTTIDHKVAIYSYYFHRLLQRAKDVTIVYNRATEDGKTGEMSRFMLQMLVESGLQVRQLNLQAGQRTIERQAERIEKTSEVMNLLLKRFSLELADEKSRQHPLLTPSAINRYMRCPLQFYYYYVSKLSELEENEEDDIDGRTFGNIFHNAAQHIYSQFSRVTTQPLMALLKNKIEIERAVDNAIKQELFRLKEHDRMPELNGLQIINREVIIRYLRQLMTNDCQLAPFTILGLEYDVMRQWNVTPPNAPAFTTTIGGTIDRLDRVTINDSKELIRVVDYKTGRGKLDKLSNVDAIFDTANIEKHSDYYLQTFLYGLIVDGSEEYNKERLKVVPALFFVQHSSQDNYNPILELDNQPIEDIGALRSDFEEHLSEVINEIFNPQMPFCPTTVNSRCATCPFKPLCKS